MKTLTEDPLYNKRMFQHETRVLRKIGPRPHVVELCASFIIGDHYMMLFPWAEGGNLATMWECSPPTLWLPRPGEELGSYKAGFVRWVADQCCGLVNDLHEFHGYFDKKYKDREGRDQYGIHGDIKPQNILCFTAEDQGHPMGTLKLADFGLAAFHRACSRTGKHWPGAGAATQAYRSPEHDIGPVRSRKVDMWSLGCVFSELCTWLIQGPEAIREYDAVRIGEYDPSRKSARWGENSFFVKHQEPTTSGTPGNPGANPIPQLKTTVSQVSHIYDVTKKNKLYTTWKSLKLPTVDHGSIRGLRLRKLPHILARVC